jgi:hypothetical protein
VIPWLQLEGTLYALPAARGEEPGSYLWLEAGRRDEAVVAELFLPAVGPEALDNALGIAIGSVEIGGLPRTGEVQLRFGRVVNGTGVLSADGEVLAADVRFEVRFHPRSGGFCPRCGGELQLEPVIVITPPDGGLIGEPLTRCGVCGED